MRLLKFLRLQLWTNRSGFGICLCALYVALTVWFVIEALTTSDPKGNVVLLQIPLMPAVVLIQGLHLDAMLHDMPTAAAYLLLFPLTLFIVYFVGWLLHTLWRAITKSKKM